MSTTTSGRGTQEVGESSGRQPPAAASSVPVDDAPVTDAPVAPAEVLIEEARRRQRRRWAACLVVVALVGALVAGLLASLPPSHPTRPASGPAPGPLTHAASNLVRLTASAPSPSRCPTRTATTTATLTTTSVTQSLDGAFSGCIRVGNVASGPYHVVLNSAITMGRSYRAPHEPRMHLSISPRSGRPGTRVTVTGVVSVPHELTTAARPNSTSTASICWGGCPGGLTDSLSTVRWSSSTTFRMTFKVPAAPWIEVGPSGKGRVEPLTSGTYRIGVRCVGPFDPEGCGVGPAEATVSFRIVVPKNAHVARCPTPTSCAFLEVGPRSAFPAQAVEVKGVAPLVSMIGTQPFGARLEVLAGPANGPQVVFGRPATRKASRSSHWIHMGDATLDVERPPSFASLGHLSVVSETAAGLAPLSENPAAPERVAHCAPGDVVITSFRPDGAVTTTSVPTAGAVAALAQSGYPRVSPPHDKLPSCTAVALTASVPDVFVAFQVAVTPTYTVDRDVALQTFDDGASWSILPVPTGATTTGFGGFRYQGSLVDSVFSPTRAHDTVRLPLVEQFDPASGTWKDAALMCPSKGPCVTLGAFSSSNCAGGIHADQELLHSTSGGMSWSEPAWPSLVDPCGRGQLAAVSASTELLVHGSLRYPYLLLRSTDGGTTWSDVGLPRAPSAAPTGTVTGQVSLLSDGALLLITDRVGTWELLEPGSQRWCMVRSIPASVRSSVTFADLSVLDGQLWWVTDNGATSSRLDHVVVSSIGC